MDWTLIQGVFLPSIQGSMDKFEIHCNPDQDWILVNAFCWLKLKSTCQLVSTLCCAPVYGTYWIQDVSIVSLIHHHIFFVSDSISSMRSILHFIRPSSIRISEDISLLPCHHWFCEFGSTFALIKSVFKSESPLITVIVGVGGVTMLANKKPTPSAETNVDKAQRQATVLLLCILLSPANCLFSLLSNSSSKGLLIQIWHLVHTVRLSLSLSVRKIQIFLQLMCLAFSTMPQWVPMWNPAHNNVNSFVLIIRPNSCHPKNLLNGIKLVLLKFMHSLDYLHTILTLAELMALFLVLLFFWFLTNVCWFWVAGSRVLISPHLL